MKKSIKVLITIIVIAIQGIRSKAQNVNAATGIYVSENDYKTKKLSYNLSHQDKLQLNEFLGGNSIKLIYQGKKMKFPKNEIFGYKLDGQDFRFYNNFSYKIVDTAGFILYSRRILTPQGKGSIPVLYYFYSVSYQQPILQLTLANLYDSFPRSTEFRYSLQNYFRSNEDLIGFDKAENQYKIKYLYFKYRTVLAAHPGKH